MENCTFVYKQLYFRVQNYLTVKRESERNNGESGRKGGLFDVDDLVLLE